MIGDANGNTSEEVAVSIENPFVERYCKLLNSLKPTKGHWGIVLEEGKIYNHFKEKQITNDDYNFLIRMMFEEYDENTKFEVSKSDDEYSREFFEGVRAEASYSFLVFKGVDLYYVDESGEKNQTTFE